MWQQWSASQRSDSLDGKRRDSSICNSRARQGSKLMKTQYPLFSQVALAEDLPKYHLKRGDIATVVEHYPMPDEEEDGYSLEGFGVPNITIEVSASQILSLSQWQQEKELLAKIRQLSQSRLLQLEEYLEFLLQKDKSVQKSA
jgi:hypothetical protein